MSERPDRNRSTETQKQKQNTAADRSRRAALARLGLAVGIAYVTPTILSIDRSARAMGPSCSNSNAKGCR